MVEGLSTCQDLHLTEKPRAGQGSLLREAKGVPSGLRKETPEPCTRTSYHRARLRDFCLLRGRDKSSCGSGHSPATLWVCGVGGPSKKHSTNHVKSPCAGRSCCDCGSVSGSCLRSSGSWEMTHEFSLGDRGAQRNVRSTFRLHPRTATSCLSSRTSPPRKYHSRKKYYMQSVFPQELISDYSYSRCGGAEIFSIYSYSRGGATEFISNSGHSGRRGTERP